MQPRVLLLLVALVQAAAPGLLFFNGFDQQSGRPPTPIVPASYAFIIWGAIYGLSLLFAALQLIRGQAIDRFSRIFGPAILLFVFSTVWLLFARFGPNWATVPTIIAMLLFGATVLFRIADAPQDLNGFSRWCAPAAFGLYAGWLTVATFANFTEIATDLGFGFFGLAIETWTLLALVPATALACAIVSRARGNWFYAAAVLWALAAIAVANVSRDRPTLAAAAGLAGAVVLAATFLAARRNGARVTVEHWDVSAI